jgi:hypothetical protein
MREIDLPRGSYRWRRPLNKRLAWFYVALAVMQLAWFFTMRNDGSPTSLFFAVMVVSIGLGLLLAGIFKDAE